MRLSEVYKVYRNYLFVPDTHIIDIASSIYVTRDLPGDPLWLFPYGASGYGKTEFVRPFMDLEDLKLLDTITSKAFTSGELNTYLSERSRVLLFADLAGIVSESDDEKKKIFSQFRTLFDGYLSRSTGTYNVNSRNVKTSVMAFSTPTIKRDLELGSLMGTREIMYELPKLARSDRFFEKQIDDVGRLKIKEAVEKFMNNLNSPWIKPDEETKKDIREMAIRIATWRADGLCDEQGYLLDEVTPEMPKRLYNQLIKLWKGLIKIGVDTEKAMQTLGVIEYGTGNKAREKIFSILTTGYGNDGLAMPGTPHTQSLKQLAFRLNISPAEARKQLMILRSLGRVEISDTSEDYGLESNWSGVCWEYYEE